MSDVRQLSGPEMADMMKVGTRVKRGADWKQGNEDGPGLGRVTEKLTNEGWIRVLWDNRRWGYYRMGCEGKYELQLAEP